MKPIAAIAVAALLLDVDSTSIHWSIPAARGGHAVAIATGQRITAGAIGGRFELVDTLWVNITSDASLDLRTGLYRYSYVLRNDRRSRGELEWFELAGVTGPIEALSSPSNWRVLSLPTQGDARLIWVPEPGLPPDDWVDNGVDVYVSEFAVGPGDSLAGFALVSPEPPGSMKYRVKAFEPLRSADEEYFPFCPYQAEGEALGPVIRNSGARE